MKQLNHNWMIHDDTMVATLKRLLEHIDEHIIQLESCVECYIKYGEEAFFTRVCQRPHLLVWAKYDAHLHWPAKVMSVDSEKTNVMFFGEHTWASLKASDCFLFSQDNPNGKRKFNIKVKKSLLESVDETEHHILELEGQFGFKYAAKRSRLNIDVLQAQKEAMMPKMIHRDVYLAATLQQSK
jgi:hypothetical protein